MTTKSSIYLLGPLYGVYERIEPLDFFNVEEEPLLERPKAIVLAILGSVILFVGVLVQTRISTMLTRRFWCHQQFTSSFFILSILRSFSVFTVSVFGTC